MRARWLTARFYSAHDHTRLYLVALALQRELPANVRVHCDLAPAQGLWHQRAAYAGLLGNCEPLRYEDRPLSDLVNPLVVTELGLLKPIAYDFDGRFDVAPVEGLSCDRLLCYKQKDLHLFQTLIGRALAGMQGRHELVDWFDHSTRLSAVCDR